LTKRNQHDKVKSKKLYANNSRDTTFAIKIRLLSSAVF